MRTFFVIFTPFSTLIMAAIGLEVEELAIFASLRVVPEVLIQQGERVT